MNCNDCCREINACVCSYWGGKVLTEADRQREERTRRFFTGDPPKRPGKRKPRRASTRVTQK